MAIFVSTSVPNTLLVPPMRPGPSAPSPIAHSAGWPLLDWSAPWMQPYQALGAGVQRALAADPAQPVWQTLNTLGDCGRRFVAHTALPQGEAYEHYIGRTGCVPTRDNLHDALNGLVWQRFTRTKARLNSLQAEAIAAQGVGERRGAVRDALTLFDENGAILLAPPALWNALLARQWQRAFVQLRPLWQQAQLVVVGHALLEKLVSPRKPVTAHVFCPPRALQVMDNMDCVIADHLNAAHLATKPFTPLPVMGVPGWCAENENFSFYDDSAVFRAARQPEPT